MLRGLKIGITYLGINLMRETDREEIIERSVDQIFKSGVLYRSKYLN